MLIFFINFTLFNDIFKNICLQISSGVKFLTVFTNIIFLLTFLFISNWFQIISFTSIPFKRGIKTSRLKNNWINKTLLKKTGLKISEINIFHDKKMYGMMAGLPFWPKMVLSEGLYKTLNRDELEWVILHEAGHCVLWHNLKALFVELFFLTIGLAIIYGYQFNFVVSFIIAVSLSLICIQTIRWTIEYKADEYAIERVDNPEAVITAQDKFRNSLSRNFFSSENSIGRWLFHWNIPRSKRIEMVNKLSPG